MKTLKLFILSLLLILAFSTGVSAQFYSDIIVTSPNGIWTDSRAYSTLNAAITAVGANQRTIVIANAHTVTSLTVPANVTLKFERDGSITNSGQLTINTKNIIADDHQIFTGTGDIDFAQGTIVKSSWFNSIYNALTLTSDDTVTMLITRQETLHTSAALGNNVTLKWDSQLMLGVDAGITLSNIGQVEAGLYQIFSGAGNFRFRDGTKLNLSWFAHLRSAINHISTNLITLEFQKTHIVDYSDTVPANIKLVSNKGILSINAGITLTFSGQRLPLSAFDSLYLLSIRTAGSLALDIDRAETVSTNTTIGTGISIYSSISNILTVSNGITLTINGPFEAGPYQVFNCVGTGKVVFLGGAVKEVYPEWWGIDGTADEVQFNAAIASISSGKVIGSGNYTIADSIINNKSNVHVEIHGTLDASALYTVLAPADPEDNTAIVLAGTSVSTTTLTAEATEGAVTIALTSVAGLAANDMLVVELGSDFGGASIGEGVDSHLCKILSIASLNVTVDSPMPKTFPVADALVRKVTLIENSSASVGKMIGSPYNGFLLKWARNCTVKGEVNPVGKNAFYIHRAFGNTISGVLAKNPTSTVSPRGYGFLIDYGSADNTVENCVFEDVRENSFGHNARRNVIRNNTVIRPVDNAFNTHGLGETDNVIEGNRIIEPVQYGISIGLLVTNGGKAITRRNIVRNNIIERGAGYAIREVQFSSTNTSDTIIEGNIIRSNAVTSIFISGSGTATDNTNPIIRNNTILNSGGRGIELAGASVVNAVVTGNKIVSSADDGIILNNPRGRNKVSDNEIISAGGYGIRELQTTISTLTDNQIINNTIYGSANTGIYIYSVTANAIRDTISGNIIGSAGNKGIELSGAGVVNCIVDNNTINTTTGNGILITGSDGNKVRNNVLRSIGGSGIVLNANTVRAIIQDNQIESSTGAAYTNIGDAAPAAGTWVVGDKVQNVNPAAGEYSGWICTTAPNTFKGYGIIQTP